MKKLFFTLLLLLAVTFIKAQTTMEEYNYITKGYKVQVESGLDMKAGYELKDVERESSGDRMAQLRVLYRVKGTTKETAAYMIQYEKKGQPTEYICIPHPGSDQNIRLTLYWKALYSGTDASEKLQLITYLMSRNLRW